MTRLLVFDTHPIQYRSPVFSSLHEKYSDIKVFFFNEAFDGGKWWFHEVGKIPKQKWGLSLKVGFPNEVIETSGLPPWRIYKRFKEILLREKPKAVALYGYYLPEHWILRILCGQMNIPILFIGETFSESQSSFRKFIKKPMLDYFFQRVGQFIAIGDKTQRYYLSKNIEEGKITRAKYCTDTRFFELPSKDSQSIRRTMRDSFGIPQDAYVMLFVGRLFERKRPEDVITVFDHLRTNPNFYAVVAGNGPMESSLKSLAEDRLLFVGFQNQTQIKEWYHASDLLFVPSEYETWGLVVNEAFACGLPAIVTETCGVAEDLVVPGQTGYTYKVGDTKTAALLIEGLLQHPDRSKTLGENARKKVTSEYRTDQFADAMLSAFRKVVSP